MITKILLTTLLSSAVFYSGCDSSNSPFGSNNNSNIDFEKMLTDKNYLGVINHLKGNASKDMEYITLGSAYMGLSGLNINDVISKICESGDDSGHSLMKFTYSAKYDKEKCAVPLSYLNQATNYFMKVIGTRCTTDIDSLTEFEKEVCVYKGLSQTMESVTTLNYIKQQDLNSVVDGVVDKKLKAASCAMEFAFNGSISECSIYKKGQVHFQENDKTYEQITVYTNGAEFEFLLANGKNNTQEVIVTNGYCKVDDYSSRVDSKNDPAYSSSSFHACPINLNEDITKANIDHFTTNEFIVNSFNEGVDAILAGSDNKRLKESVEGFKKEIFDARENKNKSTRIDEEDMIQFLKKQNI